MNVSTVSRSLHQNGIALPCPCSHARRTQAERRPREAKAGDGGDRREHQRFGNQLRDDAAAARAERGAHGDLGFARDGASEHQRRDVGGAQQQERDEREIHHVEKHHLHAHIQRRAKRRHVGAHFRLQPLIRQRIRRGGAHRHRGELRLRGVERDAGREPAEHRDRGPSPRFTGAPSSRNGIQRFWLTGKPNAFGITPTMVYLVLAIVERASEDHADRD